MCNNVQCLVFKASVVLNLCLFLTSSIFFFFFRLFVVYKNDITSIGKQKSSPHEENQYKTRVVFISSFCNGEGRRLRIYTIEVVTVQKSFLGSHADRFYLSFSR